MIQKPQYIVTFQAKLLVNNQNIGIPEPFKQNQVIGNWLLKKLVPSISKLSVHLIQTVVAGKSQKPDTGIAICDSDKESNQAGKTANSFFSAGHVRDLFKSPRASAGQRLSGASGFHFLERERHRGCNRLLKWG